MLHVASLKIPFQPRVWCNGVWGGMQNMVDEFREQPGFDPRSSSMAHRLLRSRVRALKFFRQSRADECSSGQVSAVRTPKWVQKWGVTCYRPGHFSALLFFCYTPRTPTRNLPNPIGTISLSAWQRINGSPMTKGFTLSDRPISTAKLLRGKAKTKAKTGSY